MAVVVLLLVGSKKLPDMARGLGQSMRILQSETRAMREEPGPLKGATPPASGMAPAPTPPQDEAPATGHDERSGATTRLPEQGSRPAE